VNQSLHIIHQAIFGGIAAAGFGVLFNYPRHWLPMSFASGMLALTVRTLALDFGCPLPLASFYAATVVSLGVEFLRSWPNLTRGVLAVVGCIPMVPGSLASKAVIDLFYISRVTNVDASLLVETAENVCRFTLTMAAMATALVLPGLCRRAFVGEEEDRTGKD
jgi:uncharacterized membrane protein YjjB (DUF3815 family)